MNKFQTNLRPQTEFDSNSKSSVPKSGTDGKLNRPKPGKKIKLDYYINEPELFSKPDVFVKVRPKKRVIADERSKSKENVSSSEKPYISPDLNENLEKSDELETKITSYIKGSTPFHSLMPKHSNENSAFEQEIEKVSQGKSTHVLAVDDVCSKNTTKVGSVLEKQANVTANAERVCEPECKKVSQDKSSNVSAVDDVCNKNRTQVGSTYEKGANVTANIEQGFQQNPPKICQEKMKEPTESSAECKTDFTCVKPKSKKIKTKVFEHEFEKISQGKSSHMSTVDVCNKNTTQVGSTHENDANVTSNIDQGFKAEFDNVSQKKSLQILTVDDVCNKNTTKVGSVLEKQANVTTNAERVFKPKFQEVSPEKGSSFHRYHEMHYKFKADMASAREKLKNNVAKIIESFEQEIEKVSQGKSTHVLAVDDVCSKNTTKVGSVLQKQANVTAFVERVYKPKYEKVYYFIKQESKKVRKKKSSQVFTDDVRYKDITKVGSVLEKQANVTANAERVFKPKFQEVSQEKSSEVLRVDDACNKYTTKVGSTLEKQENVTANVERGFQQDPPKICQEKIKEPTQSSAECKTDLTCENPDRKWKLNGFKFESKRIYKRKHEELTDIDYKRKREAILELWRKIAIVPSQLFKTRSSYDKDIANNSDDENSITNSGVKETLNPAPENLHKYVMPMNEKMIVKKPLKKLVVVLTDICKDPRYFPLAEQTQSIELQSSDSDSCHLRKRGKYAL